MQKPDIPQDGQAGAIEITPDMMERGVWALLTFAASDYQPAEDGLRQVLQATLGCEAVTFHEG